VLNDRDEATDLRVQLAGLVGTPSTLHRYRITEASVSRPDFKLEPETSYPLPAREAQFTDSLPPFSITTYTTYRLPADAPGVTAEN
jgi:hypothetical protein